VWPYYAVTLSLFEPKINKRRHIVEDYYCAKVQDIPIRGFCFIVLTYPHTHTYLPTHTSWQSDRNIAAAVGLLYVVADNERCVLLFLSVCLSSSVYLVNNND